MGSQISINECFGNTLLELGKNNNEIVVLDADISRASKTIYFNEAFPDRFYNVGIAEQNMVSIASGLARMGFVPFTVSLAKFITTRSLDQVINSVAYPDLNVKIVGIYAGLSIGKDGATHQALEDISIMRAISNMTILCPGSSDELESLLSDAINVKHPTYIRLSEHLDLHPYPQHASEFSKGIRLYNGDKLTVITTGIMTGIVYNAIKKAGCEEMVEMIHLHTLKPIDEEIIKDSAKKTGKVLTFEEHNVIGGLGSIVADVLSETGVIVKKFGVNDSFGCSGSIHELLDFYSLSEEKIAQKIKVEIR